MELLDRYLQAVRFFLPRQQQDDIVRELSENLVAQIEDREASLGRTLTEDEQAEILRRHGHPLVVAGRYRSSQRLIGPALYPIYVFALKLGLGVALIVSVVVAVVSAAVGSQPVDQFIKGLLAFPERAMFVFAWTTLGFAAVDFMQSKMKLTYAWDPRTLPRLAQGGHRTSRLNAVCELLISTAALVWLLLVPSAPHLAFGSAASKLAPAPVWEVNYAPLVVLLALGVLRALVDVASPSWTPAKSLARIALQVASLGIIGVMLRAGQWVVARPGATMADGRSLDRAIEALNRGIEIGMIVAAVVMAIEIVREAYRIWSRRQWGMPDAPARARH